MLPQIPQSVIFPLQRSNSSWTFWQTEIAGRCGVWWPFNMLGGFFFFLKNVLTLYRFNSLLGEITFRCGLIWSDSDCFTPALIFIQIQTTRWKRGQSQVDSEIQSPLVATVAVAQQKLHSWFKLLVAEVFCINALSALLLWRIDW